MVTMIELLIDYAEKNPLEEIVWEDTLYRYNPEKGIIEYRKPHNKTRNKWYSANGINHSNPKRDIYCYGHAHVVCEVVDYNSLTDAEKEELPF